VTTRTLRFTGRKTGRPDICFSHGRTIFSYEIRHVKIWDSFEWDGEMCMLVGDGSPLVEMCYSGRKL